MIIAEIKSRFFLTLKAEKQMLWIGRPTGIFSAALPGGSDGKY
jgi:hypothetical protein